MSRFEDLKIWKDSMRLTVSIYRAFSESRDFSFRDQICRAAVSVPSNIAEGYERHSHRDFVRFLRIAMGSLAELRTQLYLAQALEKIDSESCSEMIGRTKRLAAQITTFIRYRENNERQNPPTA